MAEVVPTSPPHPSPSPPPSSSPPPPPPPPPAASMSQPRPSPSSSPPASRLTAHLGSAPLTFSPLFANKTHAHHPSTASAGRSAGAAPAQTSDGSSVGFGEEDTESPTSNGVQPPRPPSSASSASASVSVSASASASASHEVVTGINITSVLENPRHQITLLEDVWTAEAEYVVPPCLHPKYANPPTRTDFEPYVKRLHKAHEAAGRSGRRAVSWSRIPSSSPSTAASSSSSSTAAAAPSLPPPSTSIVPPLFFSESFDLRVPATFEAALGVSSAGLQQRLSHYLDTVEDEISRHVRDRATDFVAALSTLQNLETNVGSACSVIAALQARMARLRKVLAEDALKRLAKQRRQARLKTVRDKLRIVKGLTVAHSNIEGLHRDGSYAAALDALDDAHTVMRQQLDGVVAVAPVRHHFKALRKRITRSMTDKFTSAAKRFVTLGPARELLADDLLDGTTGSASAGAGVGAGAGADHEVLQAALDVELRPLMEGLVRVGGLWDALDTYSSALRRELKLFVRTNVRESLRSLLPSAHLPGPNDSVVGYIDELTPQSFALVLSQLMDALLALFQRGMAVHELVERVMDVVESSSNPKLKLTTSTSPSKDRRRAGGGGGGGGGGAGDGGGGGGGGGDWRVSVDGLRAASSGVLAVVNATIQKHVSQLLAARKKYHLSIRVHEMKAMCEQANQFADAANKTAGPSAPDDMQLWEEVRRQMEAYLNKTHEKHKEDIERLIVSEVWAHSHVAVDLQRIADAISRRGREDGDDGDLSVVSPSSGAGTGTGTGSGHGPPTPSGAAASSATTESDVVIVDGTSFKVVQSCLMLLKMMWSYLSLARAVPAIAGDASTKLAELLRAFNVRARDLVLRAGALKLTGASLKKINTSHLARCSSSLGAIHAALPCVREAMSRHASRLAYGSSALGTTAVSAQLIQLDAVASDLAAHRRSIVDKIVRIVMDITDSCCTEFDRIDWNENSPDRPSKMMSGLTRSLDRLRTSLVKYLTDDQLDAVFCNIAVQMSTKIPVVFSRVAVSSLTIVGKSRLEIDIRYLLIALRKCPGLGDASSSGSPMNGGGGGVDPEAPIVVDDATDINMGQAALSSMESWVARQYPGVGASAAAPATAPAPTATVSTTDRVASSSTPPLPDDGPSPAVSASTPDEAMTAAGTAPAPSPPVPPPRTHTPQ